jgi:hypothetical protein
MFSILTDNLLCTLTRVPLTTEAISIVIDSIVYSDVDFIITENVIIVLCTGMSTKRI